MVQNEGKRKKPGRYMDLKTDHGFKTAFSEKHEKLMRNLLNGIFEGQKEIVEVKHLPLEQLGFKPEDRDTIYDLHCKDELGARYIVEMQVARQKYFMERCWLYAAAAILKQAKKGKKWDYGMKPLFVIAILNFNLTEDNTDYISCYSLMDEKTKEKASDKVQFIIIELSKFNKTLAELETDLDRWLYCMKHLAELLEQPEELKGEIFDELFELADLKTLTEEDMTTYEKSFERCYGAELAADYAMERGMEKGIQQGREQGIQQGREQGIQHGILYTAKRMKEKGLDLELIVSVTGYTPEQLRNMGLN